MVCLDVAMFKYVFAITLAKQASQQLCNKSFKAKISEQTEVYIYILTCTGKRWPIMVVG